MDLWSLGVILYSMLVGFPPFYDESNAALIRQIRKADYAFHSPYWDGVSAEAKDLVSNLLVVDPAQRFTVHQCLEHAWIRQAGELSSKKLHRRAQGRTRRLGRVLSEAQRSGSTPLASAGEGGQAELRNSSAGSALPRLLSTLALSRDVAACCGGRAGLYLRGLGASLPQHPLLRSASSPCPPPDAPAGICRRRRVRFLAAAW